MDEENLLIYQGYVIETFDRSTGWAAHIRRAEKDVGVVAFCGTRDEAIELAKQMVDDHKEQHPNG